MDPSESHNDETLVDPLRQPPASADLDLQARHAKAKVAGALFSGPSDDSGRVTVGRYAIRGRLGAGGMGAVYRAHDPELDREVALKVLLPDAANDDDARARMVREARALAKLSHPNVIPVYDVGRHGAEVFVAMELVEGRDLSQWLKDGEGARPWREVLEVFVQAGRGLAAAHDRGLVHRDFKPANVLLGDDGRARVVDFGLARPVDPSAAPLIDEAPTRTGAILGTPMYMAPEQLEGRGATAASDQFAFCVSLYSALYGARPFRGGTVASYVSQVIAGEVIEPEEDEIPRAVYRAVRRGLSTDPEDRWGSLRGLIEALETGKRSLGATPVAAGAASSSSSRWLVGAAAVALLAGGGWWLAGGASAGEPDTAAKLASGSASAPVAIASEPELEREPAPAEAPAATEAPAPESGETDSGDGSGTTGETETGSAEPSESAIAPEPDAVAAPPARARDWCSFHEDSYALIDRGTKRRRSFTKDGKCWSCRKEASRSRIARLSPRDCGGYQMCTPGPREDCS